MKRSLLFLLFTTFVHLMAQKDCVTALNICGNSNINYSPNGYGNVYESLGGCLATGGENHSVWYRFEIATSGTLTFEIVPSTPVDYDWAVYGPNVTCNTRGLPIRCNAAGTFGATGLNMTSTLLTGAPGSLTPYCRYMDVVAGQTYYLFIDNWVGNGYNTVAPFSLTWGGTATLADPFTNTSTAPHPFIPPGNPPTTVGGPREIPICGTSISYDFNTLTPGIINNNPNFTVSYHLTTNDALAGTAPLTSPYTVNTTTTYYYSIAYHDPNNNSNATCRQIGSFKFADKSINLIISSIGTGICPNGGSLILTSNQLNGNIWSTGATTQSITVTSGGTYTVTNDNGFCNATASITVNDYPNPNVQITGNLNLCDNTNTTLTATASGTGNAYSWSNGSNTSTTTITTPGTYTVTVTTQEGCQFTQSATVTAQPSITINIATPPSITCTTTQITLNANASIYPPGAIFQWTTVGGSIISGANTLTPMVSSAGTYTLRISNNLSCFKESSVIVTSNTTPPTVTISATSLTICEGDSVTLTAGGATSYSWDGLPGQTAIQNVSPNTTTTYTVHGIGSNGCSTTTPTSITITVLPPPTSTLNNVETCPNIPAVLDAGANPNYTYLWNTGETTPSITPTASGTYSVTINNGTCSRTFSANLGYILTPIITGIDYELDQLTIHATNNGINPLEYSINNGFSWQASPVFFNVSRNELIHIQVRNIGSNCSTETDYYTYFVPNTITPNGDGINDQIDFSTIVKFKNFEGVVLDRMGKIIFKPQISTPIWNGTYLGRPLPTATYWYNFRWNDEFSLQPIQKTGWIIIKNRE